MLRDMFVTQSNKKLFVTDLDGTLLKIGNELSKGVSEENRLALSLFVNKGNYVALASARPVNYIVEMEKQLGFKPFFIGDNGSSIAYNDTIIKHYLDNQIYYEIAKMIDDLNINATLIYHSYDNTYYRDRDHYPNNYLNPHHNPSIFDRHQIINNVEKLKCKSLSLLIDPKNMKKYRDLLKDVFKDKASVFSSDIDFININPLNCSKGNGVLKLVEELNININNVAAIGDSDNDISMLDICTNSFCMDHSDDEVKKHAAFIVSSVKDAVELFDK